ncbi:MAG: DUF4010 domain-containing protein [Proteobacteria bacterium]|nr:DUF4010 domain-containing protein [Pseudomonadota bacterium]MDE3207613.1 DUF4010 domain-containing protein [Pseudomonadota bacterium]
MVTNQVLENWVLLLGLSFFFGLAFEDYYANRLRNRPGGIRTFPLLAMIGGMLYSIDPTHIILLTSGFLTIGFWLAIYYKARLDQKEADRYIPGSLIIGLCNILAYLLGPITLAQPHWMAIGMTVISVVLIGTEETLHSWAKKTPKNEILTLTKFLVLTGIILPLLPNHPVSHLTQITPYTVWLAVIVVSSLSYFSYLMQRYIWGNRGLMISALLGGLYSSTATTVMLAKRSHEAMASKLDIQVAMILATALMYFRILVFIALFNLPLAAVLVIRLSILFLLTLGIAAGLSRFNKKSPPPETDIHIRNPLELGSAFIFALLFVAISILSSLTQQYFGAIGLYGMALIVGVTDIDPFVLSIIHHVANGPGLQVSAAAILIAASSNNILKAIYALIFSDWKSASLAILILIGLALGGFLAAVY